MLKRDEIANPNSCLNRASGDEPIFVLRANDESAPVAVLQWARAYALRKLEEHDFGTTQARKYAEALDLAAEMSVWQSTQIPF